MELSRITSEQSRRTAAAAVVMAWLLSAPASYGGPNASPPAGGAPSTSLTIYAQAGATGSRTSPPTVYTNTPMIGIYYGWTYPYYITPYGPPRDGFPAWWYGYPGYWPRSTPGTPFLWTDIPWYWPRSYEGPPLVEIARRVDPALLNLPAVPAPPPPPPPTQSQLARAALESRDYQRAALIYARLAEETRQDESASAQARQIDRTADRLQALALAGARQFAPAAELIDRAEREDPRPTDIRAADFIASTTEMRRIVNSAVAWAHEENSPRAWRLVAFLMEAEGRAEPAARMRERALLLERPPRPLTPPGPAQPPPGPAGYSMPTPDPAPHDQPSQPAGE